MKKLTLFYVVLLSIPILFLPNGFAEDYTQWNLSEGAKMRLGKGAINDVKFSRDGGLLAVATNIGVWLYDAHVGAEILLLNENPKNIETVAFSPDGKTFATGSWSQEGRIQLWDIDTAAQVSTMGKGIGSVGVLAFSEDGKTLASVGWGRGTRFHVWDVDTGHEVSHFTGKQVSIRGRALAVSPNHRFVVSAGRNKIFIWDTRTGSLQHTIEGREDLASSLAFSPDSKMLASGHATIRLWNVETGSQMSRLDGHTRIVNALTFSPDGKTLASGDSGGDIRLWNIGAGGDQLTLPRLLGTLTSKSKPLPNKRTFTEHKRPIKALDFNAEGTTLVSASRDNTIRLWDVDTGDSHLMTEGHTEQIVALGFLEDGKTLASGSFDSTLRLWNTETKSQQLIPVKHRWFAFSFAFSKDGKTVAIGSVGNDVQLWNIDTEEFIATFKTAHKGFINQIAFSPDDKILASGSRSGTVELWNVLNHQRIATLQGHTDEIRALTFSPDGKPLRLQRKAWQLLYYGIL